MKSKDVKLFGTFVITIILMGVAVGATTVGPAGTWDADYTNATIGNFQNIFLSGANYTANLIAGGTGWNGTGALFQNGTRELIDNWNAGAYNITADNFTAADFYLESVGNLTAYIDTEVAGAGGGWDGTGALFQNGTRELTDNWNAGAYNITADNVTVSDIYDKELGNLTDWLISYTDTEVAGVGSGGVDQMPFTFLVNASTGTYDLINSTGQTVWTHADADTVVNAALGNLTAGKTWEELIILQYDFTFDDPIDLDLGGNNTILMLIGSATLHADADGESMIEFNGENGLMFGTGIKIIGGDWSGNRAQVTAVSHCVYWNQSVQIPSGQDMKRPNWFIDMTIKNFASDGFNIWADPSSESQFYWNDNYVRMCQTAITASGIYDDWIDNGLYAGDQHAFDFTDSGFIHIDNVHTNYGILATSCTGIMVSGGYHDTIANRHIFHWVGTRYSIVENVIIRVTGSNGNTDYDAIHLESDGGTHSIYNEFHTITIGRMQLAGNNQFRTLINETDANQNHNSYSNIKSWQVGDYASGQAFQILGPDSKLRSITVPMASDQGGATDATVGFYLTGSGHQVATWSYLPSEWTEIVRITITAYTYTADADGGMVANFTLQSSAEGEVFSAEVVELLSFVSDTTGFLANRIITWRIYPTDDSDLLNFEAGDSIRLLIEWAGATGLHSETDAAFRTMTIEGL